jgi:hypothetical protein
MSQNKKFKGPWIQRAFIILLGAVLAVLLYWLLGFITKDIGSIRGPYYSKVQAEHVDDQLVKKQEGLKENLDDIKENIRNKREMQSILRDSTDSLQFFPKKTSKILLKARRSFSRIRNSIRPSTAKLPSSQNSSVKWKKIWPPSQNR